MICDRLSLPFPPSKASETETDGEANSSDDDVILLRILLLVVVAREEKTVCLFCNDKCFLFGKLADDKEENGENE